MSSWSEAWRHHVSFREFFWSSVLFFGFWIVVFWLFLWPAAEANRRAGECDPTSPFYAGLEACPELLDDAR